VPEIGRPKEHNY